MLVRPAGVVEDVAGAGAVGTVNGSRCALSLVMPSPALTADAEARLLARRKSAVCMGSGRGGRRVAIAGRQIIGDIERLDVITPPPTSGNGYWTQNA